MNGRTWRLALPLLLFCPLLASSALAGPRAAYRHFYHAKRHSASPEAFARAEARLEAVAQNLGMSERHFLEAMEMQVLRHKRRAVDVQLDGYLVKASRAANRDRPPMSRVLVFGWIEADRELPRIQVELQGDAVCAVTWL